MYRWNVKKMIATGNVIGSAAAIFSGYSVEAAPSWPLTRRPTPVARVGCRGRGAGRGAARPGSERAGGHRRRAPAGRQARRSRTRLHVDGLVARTETFSAGITETGDPDVGDCGLGQLPPRRAAVLGARTPLAVCPGQLRDL